MPQQFHEIPKYTNTSFWTDILLAFQGPSPNALLTDVGEIVVETLRESGRFLHPTHLYTHDGQYPALYVLAQARLSQPFVQIIYRPPEGESIERAQIRIQPLDAAGDHYRWTLIGRIAPLTDEFTFNHLAHEIVVSRSSRDIYPSSGYPSSLGIDTEEPEASPLFSHPDDDTDELGDHLGFD